VIVCDGLSERDGIVCALYTLPLCGHLSMLFHEPCALSLSLSPSVWLVVTHAIRKFSCGLLKNKIN
jgi:hypothetical protein